LARRMLPIIVRNQMRDGALWRFTDPQNTI
jgi:hypothetical protein